MKASTAPKLFNLLFIVKRICSGKIKISLCPNAAKVTRRIKLLSKIIIILKISWAHFSTQHERIFLIYSHTDKERKKRAVDLLEKEEF